MLDPLAAKLRVPSLLMPQLREFSDSQTD